MKMLQYNILMWLTDAGPPSHFHHTSGEGLSHGIASSSYFWTFESHIFKATIFHKIIEITMENILAAEMSMMSFDGKSMGPYIYMIHSTGRVTTDGVTWFN